LSNFLIGINLFTPMLRTTAQVDTTKTVDFSGKGAPLAVTLGKPEPQHSGGSQRQYDTALRTIAVLQTTLELEPLLRLFSREVNDTIAHSSVHYRNAARAIDLKVGRTARYRRTFRLIVERQELGRLTFTRGKPFTAKETALLEFLLSSLVYPLRNSLQYENAFQASLTDPLTGIYNRSMMETTLRREVSLARRHRTPLSMIILDLDKLKAVNDQHGHDTGDELIKQISECVSVSLRETDVFARFGGDEFAILLSNTGRQGAAVLADNIRKRIANISCRCEGTPVKITVSMGVACLTKHDTDKTLFSRADQALYRAKRAGRNRIRVLGPR
jgi:diguanylate cyclase (GGDEF)-like protein